MLQYAVIAVVAICYLSSLSAGHDFINDDFAAYVMHAANLASGRPYAAIHYVANPEAMWLAPANGYPAVFPTILAPVYAVWGLNLQALKIVTVLCFVAFLFVLAEFVRPRFAPAFGVCLLLIVSFNPVFWNQRNEILSEFPYLLFSFAALLAAQKTYSSLSANEWKLGAALLLGVLLACAYGTRTIGIVLLPALWLADFSKFRRPSRFVIAVTAFAAALILLQGIFVTWPKGYIGAVRFSGHMLLLNAIYYAKTLSYVWENGYSKALQIVVALAFTAAAGAGFAKNAWRERSAAEFYLVGYLAMLIGWSAEIGLRGLMPVLPLYFAYGFQQLEQTAPPRVADGLEKHALLALVLLVASTNYVGKFRMGAREPHEPNVQDASAQELFTFLRANTQPSEVLVFPKPRTLALFTNRDVASLAPEELPQHSADFLRRIHATILVQPTWGPPSGQSFLDDNSNRATAIFRNSEYQVFRIHWAAEPD